MSNPEFSLPLQTDKNPLKPAVITRTPDETFILRFLAGSERVDKADEIAVTAYFSVVNHLSGLSGLDQKTIGTVANQVAEDMHRKFLLPEKDELIDESKNPISPYRLQREKQLEQVYRFGLKALEDSNIESATRVKDRLYEEEDYYHAGLLAITLGLRQEAINAVKKLIDPDRYHGKKLMKDTQNATEIILKLDQSAKTEEDHFKNEELKEKCVNTLINAHAYRNAALIAIKLGLTDRARDIIKELISSEKATGAGQAAIELGDKKLTANIINILMERDQLRSALQLIKAQGDILSLERLIQYLNSKTDINPKEQKILSSAYLLLEKLTQRRNLDTTLGESADR